MVALVETRQLNFNYPDEAKKALDNISFSAGKGEFVLIAGASGSGKTTLLKHLKKELSPIGKRSGERLYKGQPFSTLTPIQSAKEVGMVFQNPDNQIVMDTVMGELAFALENCGCAPDIINKRIAEMVSFLGFQHLIEESIHTLSAGQKQMINLASVLILQPELVLLDEPTAQLDPVATRDFLTLLKRVQEELGMTIIISEHRLDDVLPLATRLIFMESGKISYEDKPQRGVLQLAKTAPSKLFIPQIPRLFIELGKGECYFTVNEGQRNLPTFKPVQPVEIPANVEKEQEANLIAKKLTFQYEAQGRCILRELSLSLPKQGSLALVGKNGTGKSTLLLVLAGLLKPRRGKVRIDKQAILKLDLATRYQKIGYLSQNPSYHFANDTVLAEFVERGAQLALKDTKKTAQKMLEKLEIEHLALRNPFDCSGGEQQLIALGITLLSNPQILLLDEPTKGLDPVRKATLGIYLKELEKEGVLIIVATHDLEFAARYFNETAMLFEGRIISKAPTKEFFSDNFFYTTSINRLVRHSLPNALIWEDVLPYVEN